MKLTFQNTQGYLLRALLFVLPLTTFFCHKSTAQAVGSCLTNSISFNTGIDPATGAVLPYGASDPKWNVSGLSAMNLPFAASTTFPYSALVVLPASLWATTAESGWLSFLDTCKYTTTSGGYYTDTFKRCFTTCIADSIQFSCSVACDDRIDNIYVDGINIFGGQPPAPNTPNLSTINPIPPYKLWLTPGQHCIVVAAMNYPWPSSSNNWNGINIIGTASSVSGLNSIVSELAGCQSYVCDNGGDTTTGANHLLSEKSFTIHPNPATTAITITTPIEIKDIAVLDIMGRQTSPVSTAEAPAKVTTFSISHLPAGMYFLKVNGIYAGKFVKE